MPNQPNHIAFIMDGNRRWAVANGLPKMEGHTRGFENFRTIIEECSRLNIPNITFWALSTDNLKKREGSELQHLFGILKTAAQYLKEMVKYDAQIRYIGDLTKLPSPLRTVLKDVEYKTKDHKRMVITLAINYGGHDEIMRMGKVLVKVAKTSSQVNEKAINEIIDTGVLPPVDLLIRTGGHRRLSGFLPWISDYAELYFTDRMWPDFSAKDMNESIEWYGKQERNFGK